MINKNFKNIKENLCNKVTSENDTDGFFWI